MRTMGKAARKDWRGVWMACAAAAALSACGGGGGGGSAAPSATLSGVAATGAPVANGNVSIRCATGAALGTTTATNGAWSVTTSGQTLPCAVQVSGGNLPSGTAYHSVTLSFGNVNITPLTDLIVARLAAATPATWFANAPLDRITDTTLAQARNAVVTALGLGTALGERDPLATAFQAQRGEALDEVLEAIQAVLEGGDASYGTLLAASVSGNFSGFSGFPAAFTIAFGGGANCAGTLLGYTAGQAGGPFADGQNVCVTASTTALTLDNKTLGNPVQNTAVQAPFAAYAFTDGSVQYEVVFEGTQIHEINVMSGGLFVGQLAASTASASGGSGSLTLVVSAGGVPGATITVDNVPRPASQTEFCDGVNDPNSSNSISKALEGVGSFHVDSCSFSGSRGEVAATVSITSPVAITLPYTVVYTYN